MTRRVLVTGCLGFIGSRFVKYTLDNFKDVSVIGLDINADQKNLRKLDGYLDNDRLQLVYADLKGDISDVIEHIDIVVHFASKTFVDHSFRSSESHVRNNIFGTFNVLEQIRKLKGYKSQDTIMIQVSTDEVYGQAEEGFFYEESPLNPTNPYSATKASADMLVLGWCQAYSIPFIITRTENNYGEYQHIQKVLPAFVKKALANEPLPVYGDGKHKRMWLHVEDHCSAIWFLIERKARGIFHIAGCEELENVQLAHKILSVLDKPEGRVTFIPDSHIRPVHDRRYAISGNKLQNLGWRPKWTMADGLEKVIKWYADNAWWSL